MNKKCFDNSLCKSKREFYVLVISPVFHVHVEARAAFRTLFIGYLDALHHDDTSLRLRRHLVGHVEIERLDFSVLQAYFQIQPVLAFGPCPVVFVREIRYSESDLP